jgi:type I restriction enzyme, S subunit
MNVPDGWGMKNTYQLKPISEIAKIITSPVDKKSFPDELPVFLCNYTDVYYNSVISKDMDFMGATAKQQEIDRFLLKPEDVVITKDSESADDIGVSTYIESVKDNLLCGYHLTILRPKKIVDGRFLSYALRHPRIAYNFYRYANGITRFGLTVETYKKVKILLPPLPEQKAIADLLSTWDKAIEKTQRLIQAKEQFKIGQLQELITNNKANSTIGAFAKPIIRKVTKPSKPYVALGIRSHFKGTFQRNVEDPNSLSMDTLYKVKKDDLIVNITFAWEGAIALVKEEDEKCYVSHRFPTYRIIQEKAEASFVRQLILSSRMKYDLSNISPGGAGRNRVLNKKDFLKMPIWIPDLEKQKNIGQLLRTLDQEIDLLNHLAEKYKTQKHGLMQKLLTGEWRIKPEILNKYKEA